MTTFAAVAVFYKQLCKTSVHVFCVMCLSVCAEQQYLYEKSLEQLCFTDHDFSVLLSAIWNAINRSAEQ